MDKKYGAKLLLLGEHSVVVGSGALAMPFEEFFGRWRVGDTDMQSVVSLRKLLEYLKVLEYRGELLGTFDLERMHVDLEGGMWFESNIPNGYGLGSSGAVCAAVYDRYGVDKLEGLAELKALLGQMESCFHGRSSGTDPLVCYVGKALLLGSDGQAKSVILPDLMPDNGAMFLVDTGVARKTTPLVNYFVEQSKLMSFREQCLQPLIEETDKAIGAFLAGDWLGLWSSVGEISTLQFECLQRMILEDSQAIWKDGLSGDLYRLKLCGAGGGGFLLGFTRDWEETQARLKGLPLKCIF